ncbi:SDR family oxidoreductase [Mesorhizobium sp. CU2]|uniref:SDR family NAD(P)-dependent oxidoreductase n=1 Tax=unclassified Mesorhizobium TaxID=325217 RepID=UPI00112EA568|nr:MULTISPECIES: SDR family oxidoreductase [unclassified Mesorhizobium]TPN81092.1 SDR family oxidoreductase [Mesorhizobium sp. CU3]TPO11687.1 SDR family oxidoreductase [Mesorhizobium sp. CU2]
MARKTKSKIMLITGAASGIGAATARLAVEAGHKVVIADINEAGALDVATSIGPNASAQRLDICSQDDWRIALDRIWDAHGRLDVLINNAAIVHTGFAADVSVERHRHTMETNFMGAATGMLAALARFKKQGSGHLVTIASMNAFLPFPGIASYAAAKHALRAFHHAVAIEERQSPVDFTIVYPTATETPMLAKEAGDDAMALAFAGNPVTPELVAGVILDAIAKKALEAYIPPERAKFVRAIGVKPKSLRQMYERNEIIGAEKLKARRTATRPD